ncbi:major outer membrane protein [Campylobacter estrildidarum]|uniref:Major outer membrane protein n=1 Tax=Campylobacter estrildidarum TaxID=2510189 RepID=A0A4V6DWF9_9BACT|nr:major outer membrane protein [Campylobacter estrildidarum]TKX32012.1 hypothetical protein CQA69_00405 [Campylobacter estrildidarum]
MKLIRLSLVAALTAGAFSVASATPVEEAIKDIDVSGVLRYRYEGANFDKDFPGRKSDLMMSKQNHLYRAQFNFSAAIADNFKAFVQFDYGAKDGGYSNEATLNEKKTLAVRQLYLTYTNEDVATNVIAGKQQLNTIWTDNGVDGLVGTGVKVVNNSIDGLTLVAFGVDSFMTEEQEGDMSGFLSNIMGSSIGNIYGAAAIGSYEALGGDFNPQLWLAYWDNVGFFYALDVAYSTTIFDGVNWTLEGAYLGNSLDNDTQVGSDNGNFFGLRGSIEVAGWDASLGGLYYGDKDKYTMTTIEDQGNIGGVLAGQEIFYSQGSNLTGSMGRNLFGYITAGYTFDETVRIGGDLVYGGTETAAHIGGGKKFEAVARVDYKYSPKLDFSAFYSYLDVDADKNGDGDHNAIRLQALYKF